jgi:hypothetical protein
MEDSPRPILHSLYHSGSAFDIFYMLVVLVFNIFVRFFLACIPYAMLTFIVLRIVKRIDHYYKPKHLWARTMQKGYEVRKNKLDGQKEWELLSSEYEKLYLDEYPKGIPVENSFIKFATSKHIKYIDPEEGENKANHFYIQHFRIPSVENFNLSITRLLQIAYNAGQFKAELELCPESYEPEFVEFYRLHKLNEITTYIDYDLATELLSSDGTLD